MDEKDFIVVPGYGYIPDPTGPHSMEISNIQEVLRILTRDLDTVKQRLIALEERGRQAAFTRSW